MILVVGLENKLSLRCHSRHEMYVVNDRTLYRTEQFWQAGLCDVYLTLFRAMDLEGLDTINRHENNSSAVPCYSSTHSQLYGRTCP